MVETLAMLVERLKVILKVQTFEANILFSGE